MRELYRWTTVCKEFALNLLTPFPVPTKKEADLDAIREEIKDMTFMERQEFKRQNLQTFARSYYVFNASDVVGIEPYKAPELTPADIFARNERIEQD